MKRPKKREPWAGKQLAIPGVRKAYLEELAKERDEAMRVGDTVLARWLTDERARVMGKKP